MCGEGFSKLQVLGQGFVLEGQDDLDDACDSRGCLEVSDVRLRRSDQQRLVGCATGAEHRSGGLGLDRVAERRPGAVCLQVSDVAGFEVGALERIGDDPLLGNAIRHRQAARGAVLVDRAAANHGSNVVAVGNRVLETLDDDDAAALTAHVTVGGGVERLAPAVGREHVRAART